MSKEIQAREVKQTVKGEKGTYWKIGPTSLARKERDSDTVTSFVVRNKRDIYRIIEPEGRWISAAHIDKLDKRNTATALDSEQEFQSLSQPGSPRRRPFRGKLR